MSTMTSADFETRIAVSRGIKASKIVASLTEAGCDAQTAARLDEPGRRLAEQHAGTRKASDDTWRIVVEMLAHSERERALCAFCGLGDPEGEPGPRKPTGHAGACSR
jgi:hypothetical protein